MSTIVIKNVPDQLHAQLKDRAKRNRRSVTKELLTIIEQSVAPPKAAPKLPPPIKLKGGPLTAAQLRYARENGRE
jgi:plasmid stability protein